MKLELRINPETPEILHVDLNSAFAMAEQQANPLLRGRPVGVTNRLNDYAICITSSYEARRLGVGLGTRTREARWRAPGFIMVESDPAKYQFINSKMRQIFESYSPDAYMKSVDEGIIDMRGMRDMLKGRPLEEIGQEIKQRIREEIGDYMTVNVGIGQNRWLAKVAASFMKPNGLYTIGADNLELVYGVLELVDLPYIKKRTKLRLNEAGIFTPLDLLHSSEVVLTKRVFRSIMGHQWYLKLRGYETEVAFGIRSVGRSYILEHRTSDPKEISALLYKACVKVARRLRSKDLAARGLMIQFGYAGGASSIVRESEHEIPETAKPRYWRDRKMYGVPVHRADQLYSRAMDLFSRSPQNEVLTSLAITSYGVELVNHAQLTLYDSDDTRLDRIERAMNMLNDRYGELTVTPALVAKSKNPMRDKVPFGTIRYFD